MRENAQGDFYSVFFDEAHALFQMPPRASGVEQALRVPFTQVHTHHTHCTHTAPHYTARDTVFQCQ